MINNLFFQSDRCHLKILSPKELIKKGEHAEEFGGYFVVKGYEKIIRMLIMTRRNYPICVRRPTWKARGALFSELGVVIRCVKRDQTATVCIFIRILNVY